MAADARNTFLSGTELPDGALMKNLMVPHGKQGVHEKLKELGKHSSSVQLVHSSSDTQSLNLHRLGLRADRTGNLVSTAWTLQVTCTPRYRY